MRHARFWFSVLGAAVGLSVGAGSASGQLLPETGTDEPVLLDGRLEFPPGAAIPKGLTEAERAYLERNPLWAPRSVDGAPTGPVRCPAEYEPMQAILLSWNGPTAWLTIVTQMANRITRFGGAEAWVVVRDAATQASATTTLTNGNVDMSKVRFFQRRLDTIWIRDYGPRYIYQGGVRAIVDHVYNRPRPNDDGLPGFIGAQLGQSLYSLPLIHGGGNYHLDALGRSYASRLINNENPSLSEPQIVELWSAFQNVRTHLFDPFPTSVDLTQHLDMWMQVIADDAVVISDWPTQSGSVQDQICDAAAVFMAGRGYAVHRTPAYSINDVHYTYTNVVMCNDIVLVPSYTNAAVSEFNAPALSAWQAALPGKTVYQINCQSIVGAAGVMHCIAMHVPAPLGGTSPTAYLASPDGGGRVLPGETVEIRWAADDDRAVTSVDLLLSTDDGVTYPTVIASATAPDGRHTWTVPGVYAAAARVRVVARDADGNAATDASDASFAIGFCPGDFNRDGFADFFDLDDYVACFEGAACPPGRDADFNADGFVDFFDYDDFVTAFESGC